MKTLMHPTMRAALGVLFLLGMWQLAAASAGWAAASAGVGAGALLVAIAVLCAMLFRRMRSEDRMVRAEAALCREQRARSRADEALAEADRLLARISGRGAAAWQDPVSQLGLVQAELMQMQNGAADPAVAARIETLRTRLKLVTEAVRQAARTAEAS